MCKSNSAHAYYIAVFGKITIKRQKILQISTFSAHKKFFLRFFRPLICFFIFSLTFIQIIRFTSHSYRGIISRKEIKFGKLYKSLQFPEKSNKRKRTKKGTCAMAYIEPRISKKSGKVTSYTIHVYDGYNSNGKRKTFSKSYKPESGLTRRQIERKLVRIAAQFEEECKNGPEDMSVNMRMSDFAPLYLETMQDKLSPTVYRGYERAITKIILPSLGEYKMTEIKPIHIQKFVKTLSTMPKYERNGKPNQRGEVLSPSSVKRKLAVLQSMFTLAVKLGMLNSSPADSKRLTLATPMRPEIEIFTKQEAAHILECLENEPLQFQALIQLAIFTGAREGELVGLRFSDVDFSTGKMTIARSAYKSKGEPVKTKPPKSNRTRTPSLNPSCIAIIRELMQERIAQKGVADGEEFDDWIFLGRQGGLMCPETPSRQFTRFLQKYGIPHRKFHSLRHTSATLLLYNGTDLKTVQERLGHADFTTTNKYLHLVEQADVDAVNSLEDLLTGNKL